MTRSLHEIVANNRAFIGLRPLEEDVQEGLGTAFKQIAYNWPMIHKKDFSSKLHYELSDHYAKLDTVHKEAINDYTRDQSTTLNKMLHKHGEVLHPDHQNHVFFIDHALKKYQTPKSFTVHSGVYFNPKTHPMVDGKFEVHNRAYTSTSLRRSTAGRFSLGAQHKQSHSHIVSLHIPEGAHGMYASPHSFYEGEREFILPRSSTFHINPTPKIKTHIDSVGNKKRVHYWTGSLVHDGTHDFR